MLLREFDAAEQHFVEAIRLDPQSEVAKENLLESLKARSTLYRGFLSFAIWLNGLSPTARWTLLGLAIAGWLGANRAAVTFPNFFWFFKAIELPLGVFFIFTYIGPILVNFVVSLSSRGPLRPYEGATFRSSRDNWFGRFSRGTSHPGHGRRIEDHLAFARLPRL